MTTDAPPRPAPVTSEDVLAFLVCALVAVVSSRYVAPALPGAASGIGRVIEWADGAASLSSQFVAFLGLVLGISLLSLVTQGRRNPPVLRALVAASGGVVYVVVALAALLGPGTIGLTFAWRAAMATSCLLLVIAAARDALQSPKGRALGLVLGSTAATATTLLASRYLALTASAAANPELFSAARWLCTLSTLLDSGTCVLVVLWLIGRQRALAVPTLVAVGVAIATAEFARAYGARDGASTVLVLLRRSLAQLTMEPQPILLAGLQRANEVASFGLALALPFLGKLPRTARYVLSFTLLSRSNVDVPILALVLTIAASLTLADPSASAEAH